MIYQVLAEQVVNCSRRSARSRQSSAGLLSSKPLEPSGLQQSPTVNALDLTPWPLEHRSLTNTLELHRPELSTPVLPSWRQFVEIHRRVPKILGKLGPTNKLTPRNMLYPTCVTKYSPSRSNHSSVIMVSLRWDIQTSVRHHELMLINTQVVSWYWVTLCVCDCSGEYRVVYVTPEFVEADGCELLKQLHSKVGM